MKKSLSCLLTLCVVFSGFSAVHAGPGHSHSHAPVTPITEQQAKENASRNVSLIIQEGKLDVSWSEVQPLSAEKKQSRFGMEWIVTFENPKIEDTTQQKLYVFLTIGGQYIAANYTGK